ncbi:MAG: AsmA family protein, partial [Burkholderiales bacterium]|nr:AsmA family protein [Burkholderiales bacterium]
ASAKPGGKAAAPGKPAPAGETTAAKATEPLDFSALKDLNASGSLRIGALTFSNIKSSNIKLDLKAKDGNVNISPLSANLYQGSLNGSVALNAATSAPQIGLKQKLTGVAIGPLLRDLNGADSLEGNGNVALDITAQGTTVDAMKRNLNGTMAADLVNGAIKGINIAARLREAKATIATLRGAAAPAAASEPQKTDFSELHAAFVIKNGIAHNEDLSAQSPLLRLGGAGDINIPEQTLNYLAKATVVATSKGQGGAGIDQLKGITVPVRITGSFEQPQYKLDLSNLANEAAKQKIDEKKEELKAKATEKLQEKLGDKLPGGLKGLFGK